MKFEVKIILLVDAETEQAAEAMLHSAVENLIDGDIAGWWLDGIDEIFEDEETVDIQ